MTDALADRRAQQERLIALARVYAERLIERMPVQTVVLAGSVARGDFNVWSDVDVIVIADALPERLPERLALLDADAPAGVQPIGFTPEELRQAALRGNRLVLEAAAHGIALTGDPRVLALAAIGR